MFAQTNCKLPHYRGVFGYWQYNKFKVLLLAEDELHVQEVLCLRGLSIFPTFFLDFAVSIISLTPGLPRVRNTMIKHSSRNMIWNP